MKICYWKKNEYNWTLVVISPDPAGRVLAKYWSATTYSWKTDCFGFSYRQSFRSEDQVRKAIEEKVLEANWKIVDEKFTSMK